MLTPRLCLLQQPTPQPCVACMGASECRWLAAGRLLQHVLAALALLGLLVRQCRTMVAQQAAACWAQQAPAAL